MNVVPTKPDLSCPSPVVEEDGFFTNEQSFLNMAQKDKFRLVLDVPCPLKAALEKESRYCHGGSLDRLTFSVWGYTIPEISVPKTEVGYGGEFFQFSSHQRPAYDPVNINFTLDNRYDNYFILFKWLKLLKNNEDSCILPMSDYMTTISVLGYDKYPTPEWDNPIAEWTFTNAFITSLGSLDFAEREATEIESNFSFAFSQLDMKLL